MALLEGEYRWRKLGEGSLHFLFRLVCFLCVLENEMSEVPAIPHHAFVLLLPRTVCPSGTVNQSKPSLLDTATVTQLEHSGRKAADRHHLC